MRSIRRLALAGALLAALVAHPSLAGDVIEGRVVSVFDGDTLELRSDSETIHVRLAGIDTPERGQPWATRSKQALSDRVFGKEVRIIQVDVDRYGRTVGEVYADDVCVGCELVRGGHAWVYRQFSDDRVLLELEAEARAAGRGIWGLPESERVPPWEWRRQKKGTHRAKSGGDAKRPEPSLECGSKHSCREMATCSEARFHLNECGLSRLDGDGDGVPCEAICAGGR